MGVCCAQNNCVGNAKQPDDNFEEILENKLREDAYKQTNQIIPNTNDQENYIENSKLVQSFNPKINVKYFVNIGSNN